MEEKAGEKENCKSTSTAGTDTLCRLIDYKLRADVFQKLKRGISQQGVLNQNQNVP